MARMRTSGKIWLLIAAAAPVTWLALAAGSDHHQPQEEGNQDSEFTFLRLVYSGPGWARHGWSWSWQTDYPKADLQFLYGLEKLSDFTFVSSGNKALSILDAEVFDYPFIYAVEVGRMHLSDQEASKLREYLLRGGFLVVDDFHGSWSGTTSTSRSRRFSRNTSRWTSRSLIRSSTAITTSTS